MKRTLLLPILASLVLGVACQKQQTEAERNAEIERRVQERLHSERSADDRQKMAERQATLEARINALAAAQKRRTASATPAPNETSSVSARTPSPEIETESGSYSTFYRKLDPYGDWMETSDYGYVFQPRQAAQVRDWRPYTNGHWVYTDAGWTWISDEKFGWATYHYGRWIRLRSVGWVWVPGEQWAPAWVSWRKGGDYVGWAPLPPEAHFDRQTGIHNWADNYYDIGPDQYAFVPANEFGRKLTAREILPTERNLTIINQTTNVTNIVYNNSFIVDRGPSYDDLRAQSRQPIERYRLERAREGTSEVPVFKGEVVALPTVDFRQSEGATRPSRVTRTIGQPDVERGWAGIQNAQEAEKARAKMQAEATPPANLPPKRFVRPEKRNVTPTQPAPVQAGRPGKPAMPHTTPLGTPRRAPSIPPPVSPTESPRPSPTAAATPQPSPHEADQNRRDVQEEKRKQREEQKARGQAEQQLKIQDRRGQKPGREEASTTPAATVTPSATVEETSPSPSPGASATKQEKRAEQRKARRAEKRAERNQSASEATPTPGAQQP
ncbi:MAG: DUF6600 domain-containing protein [Chthoniobacterales bacterium]